jgi:hypothetical protein
MVLEQVAKARTLIIPEKKNKIRIATRLQEGSGKVPYSKKKNQNYIDQYILYMLIISYYSLRPSKFVVLAK